MTTKKFSFLACLLGILRIFPCCPIWKPCHLACRLLQKFVCIPIAFASGMIRMSFNIKLWFGWRQNNCWNLELSNFWIISLHNSWNAYFYASSGTSPISNTFETGGNELMMVIQHLAFTRFLPSKYASFNVHFFQCIPLNGCIQMLPDCRWPEGALRLKFHCCSDHYPTCFAIGINLIPAFLSIKFWQFLLASYTSCFETQNYLKAKFWAHFYGCYTGCTFLQMWLLRA